MTHIIHPSKPAWAGPLEGGITQSLVSTFLTCPFQFYLYAYCGVEEVRPLDPNLIWGDILHKGLEMMIKGRSLEDSINEMYCYQLKEYPTAPATYRYTTRNMLALYPISKLEQYGPIETEVGIDKPHVIPYPSHSNINYVIKMRGKVDMLATNRSMIGDHKGKGKNAASPEAIKEEISQDFQMNYYAYAMGKITNWLYDIIRIPEALPRTPPRKVSETPEQWADRIFHTHTDTMHNFPIKKFPHFWINQIQHYQSEEAIDLYFARTVNPILQRIVAWWHHVTDPMFDPNNPACYNHIFYLSPIRNFNPTSTYSYKCRYHSFLIGKESFENLVPVKSFYPELEEK